MKFLAIDIETTGLDWQSEILTVGVAYRDESGAVVRESRSVNLFDLFTEVTPIPAVWHWLTTHCERAQFIALHNATFDLSFLLRDELLGEDDVKGKLVDTLTLARMTDKHESVSLANLAKEYGLGRAEWFNMKGKRKNLNSLPPSVVLSYNEDDAELTLLVAEYIFAKGLTLYDQEKLLYESDFCRVLAKIRCRGRSINRAHVESTVDKYRELQRGLISDVLQPHRIEAPMNHGDVIKFLRGRGVKFDTFTDKGQPTVGKKALLSIKSRAGNKSLIWTVLDAVLAAREIEKRLSTWLLPILDYHTKRDGRVHANYTAAGAFTYRLTADNPGVQAMPKSLGIWDMDVRCDLKAAEFRLASIYAGDSVMAQVFASGGDPHLETARLMFGNENAATYRKMAKIVNFAAIYASGAYTVSLQMESDVETAQKLLTHHRKQFHQIATAAKLAAQTWESRGYLTLLDGKRIYLPDSERGTVANRYGQLKARTYKGFNNLIQGGVAALVQRAMWEFDRLGLPMVGQTHDEVIFDLFPFIEGDLVKFPEREISEIFQAALPEKIAGRTDPVIQMAVDTEVFWSDYANRLTTDDPNVSELSNLQSDELESEDDDLI